MGPSSSSPRRRYGKIRLEKFGHELEAGLNEGERRENGAWWIDAPVFNRKKRQRTYWITTITVDAKLFTYQHPTVPTSSTPLHLSDFGRVVPGIDWKELLVGSLQSPEKQEIRTGRTKFQVNWSVNITQANHLASPRIETIELIGTEWDGA